MTRTVHNRVTATMTDDSPNDTEHGTNHDNTEPESEHESESGSEFFSHPKWEYGHPCPDCGNHTMHTVQISGEKYRHENGEAEHVGWTPYRDDLFIECDDCHTVLLRHPAMGKMNAV